MRTKTQILQITYWIASLRPCCPKPEWPVFPHGAQTGDDPSFGKFAKKNNFHDKLCGPAVPDASFDAKLNMEGCQSSKALQFKGKTISAGDVLLGDHPGMVLAAIQCGDSLFLHMKILELESAEEFTSIWKMLNREKKMPVQLAGRSPMWWLERDAFTFLCLH